MFIGTIIISFLTLFAVAGESQKKENNSNGNGSTVSSTLVPDQSIGMTAPVQTSQPQAGSGFAMLR